MPEPWEPCCPPFDSLHLATVQFKTAGTIVTVPHAARVPVWAHVLHAESPKCSRFARNNKDECFKREASHREEVLCLTDTHKHIRFSLSLLCRVSSLSVPPFFHLGGR